jgi:sugar/nucleoside kinase (ribokinase family)
LPLLLAVGHVTWDKVEGRDVLGGSVSYAALTARKLGWDAAVLTSASPDFSAERDLPGVAVQARPSSATTRFVNRYDAQGNRQQYLLARAADVDVTSAPEEWRSPDALLLGSVASEIPKHAATAFEAGVVGALAQGWLRQFAADGAVKPQPWADPAGDLFGVHVLFLSVHDVAGDVDKARELLERVPIVALTRGWEGMDLMTRDAVHAVPTLPRTEVDPTGAGDVFAAAFLLRYQESGDPLEAAAFASCAASCAVEGVGTTTLGDRAEVEKRMGLRERLIEDGDWED